MKDISKKDVQNNIPLVTRKDFDHKVDVIIIGAGIVGCATALELKRVFPSKSVLVFEKNSLEFGEASRYGSGVIHSGIHQRPEILKSILARRGGPLLLEFCKKEGVPFKKTGMIIAVSIRDLLRIIGEIKSLLLLLKNSRRQGISIKFLSSRGVKKIEPAIRTLFGLFISDIWIVDQIALGKKLVEKGKKAGVIFSWDARVEAIRRWPDGYEITAGGERFRTKAVVNAAGVFADEIAALAGFPGYKIFPYRGEYYEVTGPKRNLLIRTLIYPALPPGSPVKGIHLLKTIDGRLLVGPNAKPWPKKTDDFSIQTPAEEFLKAARKFLPQLSPHDLRWSHSGIRAKSNPGKDEGDFLIRREEGAPFVNIIGIDSPGFTAAFALAEEVRKIVINS